MRVSEMKTRKRTQSVEKGTRALGSRSDTCLPKRLSTVDKSLHRTKFSHWTSEPVSQFLIPAARRRWTIGQSVKFLSDEMRDETPTQREEKSLWWIDYVYVYVYVCLCG